MRCAICGRQADDGNHRHLPDAKAWQPSEIYRYGEVLEVPYVSYHAQVRDETTYNPELHTWTKFLANRNQNLLGANVVTPYPYQGETWLPTPPLRAPILYQGGFNSVSTLSLSETQVMQQQQRAWPYIKGKLRDLLNSGSE